VAVKTFQNVESVAHRVAVEVVSADITLTGRRRGRDRGSSHRRDRSIRRKSARRAGTRRSGGSLEDLCIIYVRHTPFDDGLSSTPVCNAVCLYTMLSTCLPTYNACLQCCLAVDTQLRKKSTRYLSNIHYYKYVFCILDHIPYKPNAKHSTFNRPCDGANYHQVVDTTTI